LYKGFLSVYNQGSQAKSTFSAAAAAAAAAAKMRDALAQHITQGDLATANHCSTLFEAVAPGMLLAAAPR
jgi:hypothetical protein